MPIFFMNSVFDFGYHLIPSQNARIFNLHTRQDFEDAVAAINLEIKRGKEPVKVICASHGKIGEDGALRIKLIPQSSPIKIGDFMEMIRSGSQKLIFDMYACHAGKIFAAPKNLTHEDSEKNELTEIRKVTAESSEYNSILRGRRDKCTLSLNAGSKKSFSAFDKYTLGKTIDTRNTTELLIKKTLIPFTSKHFIKRGNDVLYYKVKSPKIGEDYAKLSNENIKNHIIASLENLHNLLPSRGLLFENDVEKAIREIMQNNRCFGESLDNNFYSAYRYNALCEKILAVDLSEKELERGKLEEMNGYIEAIKRFNPPHAFDARNREYMVVYGMTPLLPITPLWLATDNGNIAVVDTLLASGADANQYCMHRGATPLWTAAQRGYDDIAKLLLNNGADINRLYEEISPLVVAALNGNHRIVNMLYEAGASNDINPYDHQITQWSKREIILLALSTTNADVRSRIIESFNEQPDNQDDQITRSEILDINKISNAKNRSINRGLDSLVIALKTSSYNVVKFLINEDNINAEDSQGITPLRIAVHNNCEEIARLLLRKGADANHADKYHSTPLMIAVQEGNFDIAKLLVKKGANVHQDDGHGITPLAIAKQNGREDISALLDKAIATSDNNPSAITRIVKKGHGENSIIKICRDAPRAQR
jgi:ankyrin repeat protein